MNSQDSITVEIRYSPDGFYMSPNEKYIVNIWRLGIWVGSRFLVVAILRAFNQVKYVRKQLKPYENTNAVLNEPWPNYAEYLQTRKKNSPVKYLWVGKERPGWYEAFEVIRKCI